MNSQLERIRPIIKVMLGKMRPIIKKLFSPRWRPLILGVGALAAIGLMIVLWPPQRSTAAYCKVWAEDTKKLQGRDAVGAAKNYAAFFSRLERVAPNDIRGDVRVEKLIFQKIAKDPTQAMSAELSGLSAASNIDSWSKQHCPQAK